MAAALVLKTTSMEIKMLACRYDEKMEKRELRKRGIDGKDMEDRK
jgi:hypothetical protein